MRSPIILHSVPFRKEPRNGQVRVFNEAAQKDTRRLNVELPTGYGKTFTAIGTYAIRQKLFGVNRLLYITPTEAQHKAFCDDVWSDMRDAGVLGPGNVSDIRAFGPKSIRHHRNNEMQVFAVTIQTLCTTAGLGIVKELLATGRWMKAIDEDQHYGIEKTWGQTILGLNSEFLLVMSATPYRPNDDSAFGRPDIKINYRAAVDEKAVKPMVGHSYIYRIDAVMEDGEIKSMTTTELADEVGSDSPEAIEKFRIEKKMRWSPKYVSPLVSIPIERMLVDRIRTGYRLQAIVGAMCVSHAELVCQQLKGMFPELAIDWVGTGTNGRDDNQAVLKRFCPAKEEALDGTIVRGEPTLDVLVHVGMAGEGLDTRNVSEIIHLNRASLNNSNNQENGRAARYLEGVKAHINFDSSSDYAQYVGTKIMDAMSFLPPTETDEDEADRDERDDLDDIPDLPEKLPEPTIYDLELDHIDHGDPEVIRYAEKLKEIGATKLTMPEFLLPENETDLNELMALVKLARAKEAEEYNSAAKIAQLRTAIDSAASVLAGKVMKLMQVQETRVEKTLAGDIRKRINREKKRIFGSVKEMDRKILEAQYAWLWRVSEDIKTEGLPSWLL